MDQQLTPEGLDRLGERVGELLDRLESHPDAGVRGDVFELLQDIDTLHREAFSRILRLVREIDPALERLAGDPVVRMVLSLYDLVSSGPPGPEGADVGVIPLLPVQRRSEQHDSFVIPLQPARSPVAQMRAPVLIRALSLDALGEGSMRGLEIEGNRVLVCRLGGEVYAFRNACPGSVLPLDLGRLEGTVVVCSWHECRFDARTGRRLDGGEGRLEVIPVSVENGEIRLALGVAAG